ncbi:MAG TPA: hypothetical protein VLW25_14875, partial [Bryobacteraceae bacterium]|nr:hypothetical protein [Bryobacteraceae bacterium]
FKPYPEGLYDYDIPEYNALFRLLSTNPRERPIPIKVEAVNIGRSEWQSNTTYLGVQLLNAQHQVVNPDFLRIPLPGPVPPGSSAVLEFTVPDPGIGDRFALKLDMVDAEAGPTGTADVKWFSAMPRRESEMPGLVARPLVVDIERSEPMPSEPNAA